MENEDDTLCLIAKVNKNMVIPKNLHNMILEKGKNIVAVITKGIKKIVLFPTNADSGIYTRINIKKEKRLDDEFFLALRKILDNYNLKTLFTTGVCLKLDECYWEGIFEYFEDFNIEQFKESLKSIGSVTSVKMKLLKPYNEN